LRIAEGIIPRAKFASSIAATSHGEGTFGAAETGASVSATAGGTDETVVAVITDGHRRLDPLVS